MYFSLTRIELECPDIVGEVASGLEGGGECRHSVPQHGAAVCVVNVGDVHVRLAHLLSLGTVPLVVRCGLCHAHLCAVWCVGSCLSHTI